MPGRFDDGREITFEIVEEIGVISAHSTGWAKEINLVSWNGGQPKYDIREWSPAHDQMSRGITLNEKEMRLIIELLRRRTRSSMRRSSSGRRSILQETDSPAGHGGGAGYSGGDAENKGAAAPAENAARQDAPAETQETIGSGLVGNPEEEMEDMVLTAEVSEDTLKASEMPG